MLKLFLFCLLLSIHLTGYEQTQNIKLPIKFVDGYGVFGDAFASFSSAREKEWEKTDLFLNAIPKNWRNVQKGRILLDMHQFAYQHYLKGNISSAFYKDLQENWNWYPDTALLSSSFIKCFIYVVSGFTADGRHMIKIDQNNNLDLSDDEAFELKSGPAGSNPDTLAQTRTIQIEFEKKQKAKTVKQALPLSIQKSSGNLWYSVPQHAEAIFYNGLDTFKLAISPGFTSTNYYTSDIAVTPHKNQLFIDRSSMIKKEEYLKLGKLVFKNKGIDVTENVLVLEKVTGNIDSLFSTQIGFQAIPFSGHDFVTNQPISLEGFKGKYLYIDFWGTWCPPCVAELPELKKLYETSDTSRISFLGIACNEKAEVLQNFLAKENILWPQILNDQTNRIKEIYNIESFPSTFLIDPSGKIIAKDIQPGSLTKKIKEILRK
jgi:thiol-disulfide isomerase/thioredoxin